MELFLLGGNSKENKEWIEIVSEYLRDDFHKCNILYYEHWDKPEKNLIDLDYESRRLVELVKNKKDYVIFAKSAGVIVTLKALSKDIHPMKCIFAGTPLHWARMMNLNLDEVFNSSITAPIIFIQNLNDPSAGFDELRAFLNQKNFPIKKIIPLPGDTHDYMDIVALKNEIVF